MKQIPLTQDKFAIVDDDDYDYLMRWKWHAHVNGRTYYAVRRPRHAVKGWKKKGMLQMHRVIMNVPKGCETDHINHNGWDNRKSNLRICTRGENRRNQLPAQRAKSEYKGVGRYPQGWRAKITHHYKTLHVGCYNSEIEAARAYDAKAKELFGAFAYLNFPEGHKQSG